MRNFRLHVITACVMFSFSLGLTKLVKLLPNTASSAPQKEEQLSKVIDLIGDDEKRLREIYREYGPAQTEHDRAFFERVESENFVLFQGDKNLTREQDIQWMMSWPKDTVYELDIESIKFVDDAAVVTGKVRAHHQSGSSQSWGFIDVCIRKGESWQILSTTLP